MWVVDGAGVVVDGGGEVVGLDEGVDVPVVVVSPGSPMSVVESFTLVVNVDVEVADVVAR